MALIRKPEETISSGNTGRNVPSDAHAAMVGYYPYNGMAGLSGQTQDQLGKYQSGYKQSDAVTNAQQQLGKYQQGYKPSDTVTAAMQRLQQIQAAKPEGYNSKYGAQLDSILAQIGQPNEFKWDFNGDELFRTYADMYSRNGRKAMENAMGNAAALTGGYGNSYGQQVGQQTYDEYMNQLYGIGMDLYDRAWQRNQADRADLYNRMGALQSADQTDYGRYRDTVGDWETERGYWTDQANNERNFDYGQWGDMLNYWQNAANNERAFDYGQYKDMLGYWGDLAARENADYWTGENFREGQRQYDTSLAENKRQYDTSFAENQRQFDTNFEEGRRQFNEQLAENIRQYNESLAWNKLSTEQKNALEYAEALLKAEQPVPNSLLQQAGLSIVMTPTGPQVVAGNPQAIAGDPQVNVTVTGGPGGPGGPGGTWDSLPSSNLMDMIAAYSSNAANNRPLQEGTNDASAMNSLATRLSALNKYTGRDEIGYVKNPVLDIKKKQLALTDAESPIGNIDTSKKYESNWKPNTMDYKKKTGNGK